MAIEPTERPELEVPGRDVRAARPYILSRGSLRESARRTAAVAALAALDAIGLALGLYAALVLRSLVFGDPIFWSLLWEAGPREWLPFLLPVTLLVFWQGGSLRLPRAPRRLRPGRLVARPGRRDHPRLRLGDGLRLHDVGSDPDRVRHRCARDRRPAVGLRVADAQGANSSCGCSAAVLLVGGEEALDGLHAGSRAPAGWRHTRSRASSCPTGRCPLAPRLRQTARTRSILDEGALDEETLLDLVETAHRAASASGSRRPQPSCSCSAASSCPARACRSSSCARRCCSARDWVVKQVFDYVVSLLVAVAGLPLWLALALAIKLDSRGPVLYRDRRVGVGEREFGMLKFRTMIRDAAAQQPVLEERNEAPGALFKIRDDPRVTRVGRLLRRLSLDELPQLLNVLRGEMSLVGPRPLPLRDYGQLEPWHRKRYHVLPGMTGLWQISGRSNLTFDDLVRLDFYYIENWSIWLDISILVRTLPAVVTRRGAYEASTLLVVRRLTFGAP